MTGVLDFLSPALAGDADGFHPVARSAAERLYRAAEATFAERDGWLVPVSVPGEREVLGSVGLADVSHLGTLEVRPAPTPGAESAVQHSGTRLFFYRLSARRALVVFPEGARSDVAASLDEAELVVDVTAAYTVLGLTGPEARALVSRLTHLHRFPSGGEVAHVTGHVLPAGSGYRILVAQEHGHHVAEVALDCARALGGGLVGVDALPPEERT